jgi:hypothetical protein
MTLCTHLFFYEDELYVHCEMGPYSIAHVALARRRAWGDLLSGGDAAGFPRASAAFQVREVDGSCLASSLCLVLLFLVLLGLRFDLPPVDYKMEGHTGVMGWAG